MVESILYPQTLFVEKEYVKTFEDLKKEKADVLVTSIDGNWVSLVFKKGHNFTSGKGIKIYSNKLVSMTIKKWDKIKNSFKWECDF